MIDINWIRKTPDELRHALQRRGHDTSSIAQICELDREWRRCTQDLQEQQEAKNQRASAQNRTADEQRADALQARETRAQLKETCATLGAQLEHMLSHIPNILLDDVPDGQNENDNVTVYTAGTPRDFDFTPHPHDQSPIARTWLATETAVSMSGTRYTLLRGPLARLHRALAQFMLNTHTQEHGYEEIAPPLMVREEALYQACQFPKMREDVFETTEKHFLIPTSEVSLVNMVAGLTLSEEQLPLRYTAYTPCFRAEAGAAGRDTRGLLRLHQFSKVELVSITSSEPECSQREFEHMLQSAETILKKLGLPYRVVALCAGDMGFHAEKTYDLEVWFPSQNTYREISSCSSCGDFQARRLKTKWKNRESKKAFVHTLNGTGIAVERALAAILENFQERDGSVSIPEPLQPYMGGEKNIVP